MVVLLLLWQYSFFHSCSGTDSCLSLCGTEFIFFKVSKERRFYVMDSQECRLLQRLKHEIWNLLVSTQPFHFFLPLFAIPLFFSLFKRKKFCVCCSERTPRFYSVEFYGTDLYNFKSSYFSIHAKYSSITTKKHVTKIRIKNDSITLIFSEHCTVALLCASISEAKKKTKTTLK